MIASVICGLRHAIHTGRGRRMMRQSQAVEALIKHYRREGCCPDRTVPQTTRQLYHLDVGFSWWAGAAGADDWPARCQPLHVRPPASRELDPSINQITSLNVALPAAGAYTTHLIGPQYAPAKAIKPPAPCLLVASMSAFPRLPHPHDRYSNSKLSQWQRLLAPPLGS